MSNGLLASFFDSLSQTSPLRWRGKVTQVVGNLIESEGPFCAVGEACDIFGISGNSYSGEVVGFRGSTILSMAVVPPQGIHPGDCVISRVTRT